jgi:hypothetical protein
VHKLNELNVICKLVRYCSTVAIEKEKSKTFGEYALVDNIYVYSYNDLNNEPFERFRKNNQKSVYR